MVGLERATVTKVYDQLAGWDQIKRILDENYGDLDEQTLVEIVETETDLPEIICTLDTEIMQVEMELAGIEHAMTILKQRQARAEKRRDNIKAIILMAMDRTGLKTIRHAFGTITRKLKPGGLIIDNEFEIPTKYWLQPPLPAPIPNKKELLAALKAKTTIPGVHLAPDDTTLQIRRT